MRQLVYSLTEAEKERLTASPLPSDQAIFEQFEIDGLYKIINEGEKRLLFKEGKCILIMNVAISQSVMVGSAVLSAKLSHPLYVVEILEAYNANPE